jgi:vacuolar-type H+-ATPase subunit H
LKSNCQTSSATKKEYEVELKKWFGNSRDRGSDSRKKIRRSTADNVENCNPETEDKKLQMAIEIITFIVEKLEDLCLLMCATFLG